MTKLKKQDVTYETFLSISEFIKSRINLKPKVGLILGSGLGSLVSVVENKQMIQYASIPEFPVSTVEGHAGQFVFGYIYNVPVVIMQGRFHYYEGYEMTDIVMPVRVMKLLGIETLFVSNASGGLNPNFKTGDLMIITDHINFFPVNPLRGFNDESFGPRFSDMLKDNHKELITKEKQIST